MSRTSSPPSPPPPSSSGKPSRACCTERVDTPNRFFYKISSLLCTASAFAPRGMLSIVFSSPSSSLGLTFSSPSSIQDNGPPLQLRAIDLVAAPRRAHRVELAHARGLFMASPERLPRRLGASINGVSASCTSAIR